MQEIKPDTTTNTAQTHLYVQSLAPRGARHCQRAVLDRLVQLEDQGVLDETGVHVWGRRIPTAEQATTETERALVERIDVFEEWARRNDVSLATFDRCEVDSEITGERHCTVTLPQMLLAEYDGDALQCVTPYRTDDGTVTVRDRLAAVESSGSGRSYVAIERRSPRPDDSSLTTPPR